MGGTILSETTKDNWSRRPSPQCLYARTLCILSVLGGKGWRPNLDSSTSDIESCESSLNSNYSAYDTYRMGPNESGDDTNDEFLLSKDELAILRLRETTVLVEIWENIKGIG